MWSCFDGAALCIVESLIIFSSGSEQRRSAFYHHFSAAIKLSSAEASLHEPDLPAGKHANEFCELRIIARQCLLLAGFIISVVKARTHRAAEQRHMPSGHEP